MITNPMMEGSRSDGIFTKEARAVGRILAEKNKVAVFSHEELKTGTVGK